MVKAGRIYSFSGRHYRYTRNGHGDTLPVLLVEDDLLNQRAMATLLKKIGFQADVVGNGLEAIRVLESRSYDVIFMDVQMPHIWIQKASQISQAAITLSTLM